MLVVDIDDPRREDVAAFIAAHLRDMHSHTPPESVHAIGVEELSGSDVTLWSARDDQVLVGMGALKALDTARGEIKSMRTASSHRGRGIATKLLDAILDEARTRRYAAVLLETGAGEEFVAARSFYARHGFVECGPFGDYTDDPNSTFMSLTL